MNLVRTPPAPSPLYAGERAGGEGRSVKQGHAAKSTAFDVRPLTPTLSPEYRGEGAEACRHE